MKKLSIVCLAVVMAVVFGYGSAFADQPASKATAKCGDVRGIAVADEYRTIFTQDLRTPTGKDLFIDVSLECGITTNTAVMSKALERALATAEAAVMVRVLVDPVFVGGVLDNPLEAIALPGEICYASRMQTLVAEFAGDFSDCISDTGVVDDECTQAEFLQLILKSLNANSFNFIAMDLLAGVHRIEVQAKLLYTDRDGAEVVVDRPDPEVNPWAYSASNAWLGNGSVTVELVRMIAGEEVELE